MDEAVLLEVARGQLQARLAAVLLHAGQLDPQVADEVGVIKNLADFGGAQRIHG